MDAIKLEKLTKSYGKARGIVNLDLAVNEGEFFGFIGPNGAGKSTTIRTLLGLIQVTSGKANIFGKDIEEDHTTILRDIGYLPSEAVYYSGMKVKDILKLSADLRHQNCTERANQLCRRLQLDGNRKIDELSFGNRKKVGIVSALQHNPKLLILDEPTSGLDPLMQKEFFNILEERNQAGTTIFLSSHVLSEIQHHCSRAAIIREGKLVVCDRVENLSRANAKRITIHGSFNPSCLENIHDIQVNDETISFLYNGEMNALIHALATMNILDLTIAEPDLEEIFLHFYQGGNQ